MTENKRFELRLCGNGIYYVYENGILTDIDFDKFNRESAYALIDEVNALYEEKEKFKILLKAVNEELDLANRDYDVLEEENEQLKKELKSIEDSFKFSYTENHIEFNKDKLKVEDTHTELTLKDGKLYISVFIPQLNEYVKFFYWVTGRKMEREFINYE